MHSFQHGAPVKIHAPGRPWHKTKGRLVNKGPDGRWTVRVTRWPHSAFKVNPNVDAHDYVGFPEEYIRLLPTLDRVTNACQPSQGSKP